MNELIVKRIEKEAVSIFMLWGVNTWAQNTNETGNTATKESTKAEKDKKKILIGMDDG